MSTIPPSDSSSLRPLTTTTSGSQNITEITSQQQSQDAPYNVLLGIFSALLGASQLEQDLSIAQSQSVNENAALQNQYNDLTLQLQYIVEPPGASQDEINQVNQANQNIESEKSGLQSAVTTLRQTGQQKMAILSTTSNSLQQTSSEVSSVLSLINQVFGLISGMIKPR